MQIKGRRWEMTQMDKCGRLSCKLYVVRSHCLSATTRCYSPRSAYPRQSQRSMRTWSIPRIELLLHQLEGTGTGSLPLGPTEVTTSAALSIPRSRVRIRPMLLPQHNTVLTLALTSDGPPV